MKMAAFNQEELTLKLSLPTDKKIISYDMGGSLLKVAYTERIDNLSTKIHMITFNNLELDAAIKYIVEKIIGNTPPDNIKVFTSGIGSRTHLERFNKALGNIKDTVVTDEMKGFSKGLHYMLKNMEESEYLHLYVDIPLPPRDQMGMPPDMFDIDEEVAAKMQTNTDKFPALLCFFGSGMGFTMVNEDGSTRALGMSMKAGLFFYGLGTLLTGAKSFGELMELAKRGDGSNVTTTMDQLNANDYAGSDMEQFNKAANNMEIEAFPFGNVIRQGNTNPAKEDMARALHNTVCEEVISWGSELANRYHVNKIYVSGSFLANNQMARDNINKIQFLSYAYGWSVRPRYLKYEGYIGVLGAILGNDLF